MGKRHKDSRVRRAILKGYAASSRCRLGRLWASSGFACRPPRKWLWQSRKKATIAHGRLNVERRFGSAPGFNVN